MSYTSLYTGVEIDACVGSYQTSAQVQAAINAAKLSMFPVGSIYMSINSTDPGTFIGGTWQRIQDTFLLAAGTTYTAGTTGGEATHTLTESEMPSHNHTFTGNAVAGHTHTFNRHSGTDDQNFSGHVANAVASNDTTPVQDAVTTSSAGGHTPSGTIGAKGGGAAHNNMPPYLTVYMWQRTA